MVEGAGFEPAKPKRQIYSLMGLTAPQSLRPYKEATGFPAA